MSAFLHHLGRWCAQHSWKVFGIWIVLLLGMGGGVLGVGMQLSNSFDIAGSEAMTGLAVLRERLPQAAGTAEPVLITTSDGAIENHQDAIQEFIDKASEIDGISMASDPFSDLTRAISDDGAAALVQVQADSSVEAVSATGGGKASQVKADLEKYAAELEASDPDLTVKIAGNIGATAGVELSITEAFGVLVAAVVLIVTFGSLLAAGTPIITAIVGVGVGMTGILLAASLTEINAVTPVLAVMIGLAVGIDYALFIMSRAREYLAHGLASVEAAGRAVATAGSAVVFAGITVIIALCGLSVAGIPFLTAMGISAAFMVAVAVAVALTAVPAFLGLLGKRITPKAKVAKARTTSGPRWASVWINSVMRLPWLFAVAVIALLGAASVPLSGLSLSLVDNGYEAPGTQLRDTYDSIAEEFGEGYNSPMIIIGDIVQSTDPLGLVDDISNEIESMPDVARVAMATPNPDASMMFIQVIPREGQAAPSTMQLVKDVREMAPELEARYGISNVMVTGITAVAVDIANTLNSALLPFGIVVVGLSLLLLMIVFRSIAVPVTATLGYLLSLGAGLGAVGAMFGWGWFADLFHVTKLGSVISFLPVIVMGILFGLAMDYEVFLVSRMREVWIHTRDAKRAVREGFIGSAKVVTAAALIMTSVFAFFIPDGNKYIKPIAVALTVGIFADAFLVRMTLIPALMTLLGKHAWWLPKTLDRVLPTVDVEGEGLARSLEHSDWVATHGPVSLRLEHLSLGDESGSAFDDVSLLLRPGEFGYIRLDSPLGRSALAAVLTGRTLPTDGHAVIDQHVLPDGISAIQAHTMVLRYPEARLVPKDISIVVSIDPSEPMWDALHAIHERGVNVLAIISESAELPADYQAQLVDVEVAGSDVAEAQLVGSEQ